MLHQIGRVSPAQIVRAWLILIGLAGWLAAPAGAWAQTLVKIDPRLPAAAMHEEVLSIGGDQGRPAALQVTLFLPNGPGPFPLAVMNHGADHASVGNRGERYHLTIAAWYFLSRGYAVALPMMRGFAGSGGDFIRAGCDLSLVADLNARDIRAVAVALQERPEIDRSRTVVAGQSFGGWNTLGVSDAPPPGTRGVVMFNAAIRGSDCGTQDASMIAGAGRLGAHTVVPSLWFYGDNDSLMPNATWRAVFDAYKRAGGRAELVDVGPMGSDSHQFLSSPDNIAAWAPKVDAFLAKIGLPSSVSHPEYLPLPPPPATDWAKLGDVDAVPYLGDKARDLYRKFLNGTGSRAFAISPTGSASFISGGYDPRGVALRDCGRFGPECRLYAVNATVVWTGPKPDAANAAPRVIAKTVPMNVATLLGAFYASNAACTPKPIHLAVQSGPAHGATVVAPRDATPAPAPNAPPAACAAAAVPAMGVTYTPVAGFSGADAVTLEVDFNGRRQVIRFEIKVI